MVMSRRYVNTSTGSKRYTMTFGKQSHSNVVFQCCNVPCTPVKLNETIFEIYNFTKTLFQVPTNCPALFRNVKWRMAPYGDKVNSFGAVWGQGEFVWRCMGTLKWRCKWTPQLSCSRILRKSLTVTVQQNHA